MLLSLSNNLEYQGLLELGIKNIKSTKWAVTVIRMVDLVAFTKLLNAAPDTPNRLPLSTVKNLSQNNDLTIIKLLAADASIDRASFTEFLNHLSAHGNISNSPSSLYYLYPNLDNYHFDANGDEFDTKALLPDDDYILLLGIVDGDLPTDYLYQLSRGVTVDSEAVKLDSFTIAFSMDNVFDISYFNTFEKVNLSRISSNFTESGHGLGILREFPGLLGNDWDTSDAIEVIMSVLSAQMFEFSKLPNNLISTDYTPSGSLNLDQSLTNRVTQLYKVFDTIVESTSLDKSLNLEMLLQIGELLMSVNGLTRPLIASAIFGRFQETVLPKLEEFVEDERKQRRANIAKATEARRLASVDEVEAIRVALNKRGDEAYYELLAEHNGDTIAAMKEAIDNATGTSINEAAESEVRVSKILNCEPDSSSRPIEAAWALASFAADAAMADHLNNPV